MSDKRVDLFSAADRVCPRQAFEGLDREGRGFLTAEGIKQVVGLDFDTEEVGQNAEHRVDAAAVPTSALGAAVLPATTTSME